MVFTLQIKHRIFREHKVDRTSGGYKELVLDNLVIEKVEEEVTAEKLEALITKAEGRSKEIDYRPEIWSNFQKVLKEAKAVLAKEGATGRNQKSIL